MEKTVSVDSDEKKQHEAAQVHAQVVAPAVPKDNAATQFRLSMTIAAAGFGLISDGCESFDRISCRSSDPDLIARHLDQGGVLTMVNVKSFWAALPENELTGTSRLCGRPCTLMTTRPPCQRE